MNMYICILFQNSYNTCKLQTNSELSKSWIWWPENYLELNSLTDLGMRFCQNVCLFCLFVAYLGWTLPGSSDRIRGCVQPFCATRAPQFRLQQASVCRSHMHAGYLPVSGPLDFRLVIQVFTFSHFHWLNAFWSLGSDNIGDVCLCVCVSVCVSVCLCVCVCARTPKLPGRFQWNYPKMIPSRSICVRLSFSLLS